MARGLGYGRGRFAVGYGPEGVSATAPNAKATLEERKALLLAELERTETLLKESAAGVSAPVAENEK